MINENVYTNLWTGPYYGFRGVQETFALTDSPRRLRGFHLYYHFYSGTKQASIRVMKQTYQAMVDSQPLSLWMSDYIQRVEGLYRASLAKRSDGAWLVRGWWACVRCVSTRLWAGPICRAPWGLRVCEICRRDVTCTSAGLRRCWRCAKRVIRVRLWRRPTSR